jgi:hypothetical protein
MQHPWKEAYYFDLIMKSFVKVVHKYELLSDGPLKINGIKQRGFMGITKAYAHTVEGHARDHKPHAHGDVWLAGNLQVSDLTSLVDVRLSTYDQS